MNTEPAGLNEKPPILLSDLLSKSDLSDLDLDTDDITINPTEASHDDLTEPDVLNSLGENITTKLIKHLSFFIQTSMELFKMLCLSLMFIIRITIRN